MKTRDLNAALKVFRDKGGTLRTRDLMALGVHTDALYALRESGRVVELGRGLYRLAEVGEAELTTPSATDVGGCPSNPDRPLKSTSGNLRMRSSTSARK